MPDRIEGRMRPLPAHLRDDLTPVSAWVALSATIIGAVLVLSLLPW